MGITHVTVDEEISGDGWWFVAAFAMLELTPEAIVGAKRLMMRLAAATGIGYHGWHVTFDLGRGAAAREPTARPRPCRRPAATALRNKALACENIGTVGKTPTATF